MLRLLPARRRCRHRDATATDGRCRPCVRGARIHAPLPGCRCSWIRPHAWVRRVAAAAHRRAVGRPGRGGRPSAAASLEASTQSTAQGTCPRVYWQQRWQQRPRRAPAREDGGRGRQYGKEEGGTGGAAAPLMACASLAMVAADDGVGRPRRCASAVSKSTPSLPYTQLLCFGIAAFSLVTPSD